MKDDIKLIKDSTKMSHRRAKIDLWRVFGSIVLYTIIIAITWVFVVVYMAVL
jgi:t-SNARE complex subunit (syntaxin)